MAWTVADLGAVVKEAFFRDLWFDPGGSGFWSIFWVLGITFTRGRYCYGFLDGWSWTNTVIL